MNKNQVFNRRLKVISLKGFDVEPTKVEGESWLETVVATLLFLAAWAMLISIGLLLNPKY
jgi:hypothetical protein